eukprot:Colp12_sorted_trinity150504_noHs@31511
MKGTLFEQLEVAVINRNVHEVKRLLSNGAPVNDNCGDQNTLLHLACRGGLKETVQLLLDAGAKPQTLNRYGRTARDVASEHGHRDCVNTIDHHCHKFQETSRSRCPTVCPLRNGGLYA